MDENDNIQPVVNPLLCYISTALDTKSTEYVINCCLPFYSHQQIIEFKDILCSHTGEKNTKNRGDKKCKSELSNIIAIFHKSQEQNIYLPKFLCDKFDAMPPSIGYELIGITFNSLIEQISSLNEELKTIKNNSHRDKEIIDDCSIIKSHLIDLKIDVRNIKQKMNEETVNKDLSLHTPLSACKYQCTNYY